jgi:hypothetical protein
LGDNGDNGDMNKNGDDIVDANGDSYDHSPRRDRSRS